MRARRNSFRRVQALALVAALLGSVLPLVEAAVAPDAAQASSHTLRLRLVGNVDFPSVVNEGQTVNFQVEYPCKGDQVQLVERFSTAEAADTYWSDTTPDFALDGCGTVAATFRANQDTDTDDERLTVYLHIGKDNRGRVSPYYEILIRDDDATPAKPTNFNAAAGDGKVTLTWDKPVHPAVTSWEMKKGSGQWEAITPTTPSLDHQPLSYVATGLTNGTQYSFAVRGKNAKGDGSSSDSSSATPRKTAYPPANPPGNLRAVGGNRNVDLSWTGLTGPITSYAWRSLTGGSTTWSQWTATNSTAPRVRIGGLANGTAYTFQVRALNGTLAGPGSVLATATPNDKPAVPGGFTVEGSNAEAVLRWTAAARATGYLYRQRTGTGVYSDWKDAGAGASFNVTGLTNGSIYSFQLRAVNGAGRSGITDEASGAAIATRPSAVRNLRPTGMGSALINFAWDAPARGSVTRYRYRHRQVGASSWGNWAQTTNRNDEISGLTLGTSYEIEVVAYNGNLRGPGAFMTFTVGGAPTAVANGHAVWNATGNGAAVTWTKGDSSSTPTGYEQRIRPRIPEGSKQSPYSTFGAWTNWAGTTDGWNPSTTLSSLDPARTYDIQIKANSGSFSGPEANLATLFGKVRYLEATANTKAGITLTWGPHPNSPSHTFTRWEYRFQPSGGTWTAWLPTSGSSRTQLVSDLIHNQAYNFQVRAVSGSVAGFPAQISATATIAKPSAPTGLRSVEGDEQITLHWAYPGSGTDPSEFQYRHRIGTAAWSTWTEFTGSDKDTRSGVVTGLTNNSAYTFEVRGKNAAGEGTAASVAGTPKAPAAKVYWGSRGQIRRANLDGSTPETLVVTGLDYQPAIAVDAAGGKVYWSELKLGSGRDYIRRANLDGTGVETLLDTLIGGSTTGGAIFGIAVDPAGGKLYWTESSNTDRIRRSNLDGSSPETLFALASAGPAGIALDPVGRKVFWADGVKNELAYGNIDGVGNPTRLVNLSGYDPIDLALDVGAGKVYWSTGDNTGVDGGIHRADLSNGANVENLLTGTGAGTKGMALDVAGAKVYWVNSTANKVLRADTTGTITASDVKTGEDTPNAVALLIKPGKPQDVAVAARGGSAILSWKDSAISDGGSVSTYEYRYKPGAAAWTEWADAGSSINNDNHAGIPNGKYVKVISGLTNGTAHQFQMRAKNLIGAGPATTSLSATPTAPPAKPAGFNATAGNGWVILSWTASTDSTITKYEYCRKSGTASCRAAVDADWQDIPGSSGSTWRHTFRGVPNDTTYEFRIRSVNGGGPSEMSDSATARPTSPPAKPTGLAGEAVSDGVKLTWTNPDNIGITHYEYNQKIGTGSYAGWRDMSGTGASTVEYTVTGLHSVNTYTFKIRAVTSAPGPESGEVTARPKPGAVTLLGEAGDDRVRFTWSGPNPGTGFTHYRIRYEVGTVSLGWTTKQKTEQVFSSTNTLFHGKSGWFEVKAVNGTTEGPVTRVTVVEGPAGAVTGLSATPVAGGVKLAWTTPTLTAGTSGTISSYEYCRKSGTANCRSGVAGDWTTVTRSTGATSTYTVTGLTTDTSYKWQVRARNLSGAGNASNIATAARLLVAPSAPTGLRSIEGDTEMALHWKYPSTGSRPDGFQYRHRIGTAAWSEWADFTGSDKDTRSGVVTGLTNSSAYTFEVRAENSAGEGTAASVAGTPKAAQAKVYWTVVDTSNNGTIRRSNLDGTAPETVIADLARVFWLTLDAAAGKLYWTEVPSSGDSLIRRANLDGTGLENVLSATQALLGIAVDPKGDKLYWVEGGSSDKIRRANLDGTGAEDLHEVAGTTGPVDVALDVANGKVYWTDSTKDDIYVGNMDGTGTPSRLIDLGSNKTPRGVALDVGTDKIYWVDHSTTNSKGGIYSAKLSDGSGASRLLTDSTTGSWDLALDVGGGKMYWSNTGAGGRKIQRANLSGTITAADVKTGELAPHGVALLIKPGKPVDVAAAARNQSAILSWESPDGGSATGFEYRYKAGTAAWTGWADAGTTIANGKYSKTVTGLTNGTLHLFQVRAKNRIGAGPVSDNAQATPTTPPAKPAGLNATAGNGWVNLSWTRSTDSTITKYEYCRKTGTATCRAAIDADWQDIPGSNGGTWRHIFRGVPVNTTYKFRIRAVNSGGPSEMSDAATARPTGAPAKPTGLAGEAVSDGVKLTWTNPDNSDITHYEYNQKTGTGSYAGWTDMSGSGASTVEYTVTGLNSANTYTFKIRAATSISGPESGEVTVRPAPGRVTITAHAGDNRVRFVWNGPNPTTGFTHYRIRYEVGSSYTSGWTTKQKTEQFVDSGTLAGLHAKTGWFEIKAVNGTTEGPATRVTVVEGPAGAVTNLSATPVAGGVKLAWTVPTLTAGSSGTITGFEYCRKSGSATCSATTSGDWTAVPGSTGTTSTFTLTGLTTDTTYKFQVRAKNLSGAGTASNTATAARLQAPAKPAGFSAAPGDGRIKLTWTASSDSSITKYQLCRKTGSGTCSATDDDDWADITGSGSSTASHIVSGLSEQEYKFRIRAVNAAGNGTMSDRVAMTPQKLFWSTSPHPVSEGGAVTVRAWLSGGEAVSDITLTVAEASGGTAESGDYTFSANKTLTIAQGAFESAGVVTVATHDDDDTDDETVNFTGAVTGGGGFLSPPPGGTLAILDTARPRLKVHLSSDSVVEGSSVTVRLQAVGTLTASAASSCSPVMTVRNHTAESGDVTAASTTFTWPSATGSQTDPYSSNTITLSANSDTDKDHERVGISVAPGCSSSVAAGDVPHASLPETVLTVMDDDVPRVAISVSPNPVAEGSSATITATMAGPATTAATSINFSLIRASGAAGDFSLSTNRTLSIAAGATTSTGTVTITANDDADSLDESVYIATLITNITDNPAGPPDNFVVVVHDDDRAPSAPVGLTATRGDTEVTLAWTGPTNVTIDKYQYCAKSSGSCNASPPGDWSDFSGSDATTRSGKVTGLTNGTAYKFRIRAVNTGGNGALSAEVSATPQPPVPAKPTGLTATGKHQSVDLSWTAPSPANATITKYQYCQKTGSATCSETTAGDWEDISTSGSSTTSATIGSLTNGTTYKFRIRAVNPGGNSPMSDSVSVAPRAVPAAPTGLTATPASGQVTLSWTDPSNSTITGYEYRYRTSGGSWPANWTSISGSSATTTSSGAITGLTNGTAYNFEVRAVNSAGDGATAAVDATPNPVPSSPTSLSSTARSGSVDLSWTTPANTTGTTNNTTITKFQYQQNTTNTFTATSPTWTDMTSSSASTTSYTVGGLTNGTTYYFRIRAVNPTGNSAATSVVDAAPAPAPSSPTGLAASAGDGEVTLSWTNPGNSTITKYQYCRKTTLSACSSGDWTDFAGGSSATTTSKTITGLSNSTQYFFRIRAVSPSGDSAASSAVNATPLPANAPAKPTGLRAAARSGQVILTWTDPSDSTITKWQYQFSTSSAFTGANWTDVGSSTAATTTATVPSLTNGATYYFRIRAVNATGNSDPSDAVSQAPVAAPAAPTGLFANPGNARVTLSWTNPNNASIIRYQYCQKTSSTASCTDADWTDVPGGSSANTTSRTIGSLTNGTTYYFRIRAVNESGNGAVSSAVSTTAGLPSKPVGFTATGKNTSVTLSWTDPSDSTITEWEFQRSSSSTFGSTWTDVPGSSATTTSHTIGSLTNGTTYYFRIRAVNSRGNGPASDTMSAAPSAKPSAPTAVSATGKHQSVTLSWTAPSGAITDYDVCAKSSSTATCSGSDWVSTGATTAGATVGSLTNGTQYYFRVRGVNNAGDGVSSVQVTATPTAVSVTPTSLRIAENSTTGSTYTVVLNSAPSADVTVTPSSSASGVVTFSPSSLTFTSSNWSTAQTVTVTPVDDHAGDIPDRSTTLSHTASGGGYNSESVPSVTVTLTDNDVIVTNLGEEESPAYTIGCAIDNYNCAVANAFTTGSNAAGYTLTSITVHTVFHSTGGNTATVNEVAIYADSTTNCSSNPTVIANCPGTTRVGTAFTGPTSLSRSAHQHALVTYTSSAGVELAANTTYWMVFDADRPATLGATNSGAQTTTDSWAIGDEGYQDRSPGGWRPQYSGTWPALFALGAAKLPSAPTGLTATAGNTQVTLSWTSPSNSAIVKYQICRKTSGSCSESTPADWADISGSDASTVRHVVKGLTNSTNYKFEIRAVVAAPGPASAEVNATPLAAVPAQPTGLSATAGNAGVDLAWTDPQDSSITKWQYQSSTSSSFTGASWTDVSGSDATTTTATVGGLTNGTQHYFRIRAVNSSGNGAASESVNATPLAVPAAPTGFGATGAGKYGEVTLSWTDPSNTSITKWQYQQSASSSFTGATWTDMTGSSASTTTYDVGSLTNGTTYYFRIRAVNGSGDGAVSGSQSATPGLPAQPAGLSASAGDGEVTLTWTNPSDSNIIRYQVNKKVGAANFSGWTNISGSTATTTTAAITSLTNGTVHKFKIRAVTASGNGAESAEVTATPLAKPAAPTGFTATAGNTQVVLAWTDPSNTSITRYEYRQKTGTAAYGSWTPISGSSATTTTETITGLTNGTQYKFRLRAVNASGNGAATAEQTATPPGLPAKPTGFTANAKHQSVDLAWTDPSNSAIEKWQYQRKLSSASSWPSSWTDFTSSATTTSFTVASLTNGTAYDFRIRAVTSTGGGPGPASDSESATPAPVPAAPTGLTAAPAGGQVTVSWTGPSDSTITKYQYQYKLSSAANWPSSWTDVSSSSSSTRTTGAITGLTNGSLYNFRVRGVNPSGDGAAASVNATPNTAPAAPTGFTATGKVQSVDLAWTNPGNSSITKYQVCRKTGGTATCADGDFNDITSTATTTSHTVGSLTNGTTYSFRIRAVNAIGAGTASGSQSATPVALPGAPTGLSATAGSGSVSLSWTAPAGSTVTGYDVCAKTSSTASCSGSDWVSTGSTSTSHSVGSLTNSTTYYFRVRAVNSAGAGTASGSRSATPIGPPAAPANFTATAGNTRIILTWDNPSNTTITRYDICRKTAGTATCSSGDWSAIGNSDAATVRHVVTGLSNGTRYAFRIRAVNNSGNGAASSSASAIPAIQPPPAPTGLVAYPSDTSVWLSWTDPQDSNITGYKYRQNTSSSFSGLSWTTISGSSATTTGHRVTGLTNGTTYYFQLVAISGGGDSDAATASATPGVPDAPYDLTATPGNTRVTLTWGRAYLHPTITKWQVCKKTGSDTCDVDTTNDWADITGANTTTRFVVTGLTNNTEYKFRIRAVNSDGNGPPSSVATATPSATAPPVAPFGLSITAGNASVTLTWDDPSDSSITKYQYCEPSSRTAACTSWSDFSGGSSASTTSKTVSGLTNAQKYWFRIRAVNAGGNGDPSVALTATPLGAPTLNQPAVADREAVLVWSSVSGASLYQYCRTTGSAACTATDWINVGADEDSNSNTVTFTVRGLLNDTAYTFKVRALNDAFTIVESSAVTVTPTRKPGRVSGLSATAAAGQVTLSWTAPETTAWRGAATGYEYCRKSGTDTCDESDTADWTATGSTATSKVVSGLSNGTTYRFRVRAKNGAGVGAGSAAVTARPVAAPGAVSGLSATASANQTITLSWTASTDGSVTKYQFCQKQGSTASCSSALGHPDWADIADSSYTTSSYVVVGLDNGATYTYRVRAVNAAGAGAASGAATATAQGAPGAPTGVTATPGVGRVTLAWTAPVGWEITGWEYCQKTDSSACGGGDWTTITGAGATATSHTIMGLGSGSYTYRVRATNAAGNGDQSAATASTSPSTSPGPAQPRNLTVLRVADGSVTLTWTWTAAPGGGRPLDQMRALTWRLTGVGSEKTVTPLRIGYDRDAGMGTFRWTETGLTNGVQYTLAVKARRDGTDSAAAASVTATPTATPPPAQLSLTVEVDNERPGAVWLTWTPMADPLDPHVVVPTGWQYSLDGDAWVTGEGCDDNLGCWSMTTPLNLKPGATYTIRVRALNGANPGPASAAVTVTTTTA